MVGGQYLILRHECRDETFSGALFEGAVDNGRRPGCCRSRVVISIPSQRSLSTSQSFAVSQAAEGYPAKSGYDLSDPWGPTRVSCRAASPLRIGKDCHSSQQNKTQYLKCVAKTAPLEKSPSATRARTRKLDRESGVFLTGEMREASIMLRPPRNACY